MRKRWLKKLNVYTSQSHKEIALGYKRVNFEPAWRLNIKLKKLNAKIFGGGSAEVDRNIIDDLLHEKLFSFKKSFFEPIKQM